MPRCTVRDRAAEVVLQEGSTPLGSPNGRCLCTNFPLSPRSPSLSELTSDIERMHAAQAVEEALKSQGNARVGAFIARGDKGLCAGHKCDRHGLHAEQVGLDKGEEQHIYLRGADLYTTLEPYAKSRTNRVPCAELISQVGTSVVHIGTYDPSLHLLRLDGAEGVEVVR